jgi:two-component system, chemotaxis family, sensor kinase CheA
VIDDDELLHEFLVESFENLDRLDSDFVELERDPGDRQILASIFRTVHTIKGTSGFLGFGTLEAVTHVGESLLGKLRDGELVVTQDITSGLLSLVDAVREILASIERNGAEDGTQYPDLVAELTRLHDAKPADVPGAAELAVSVAADVAAHFDAGDFDALDAVEDDAASLLEEAAPAPHHALLTPPVAHHALLTPTATTVPVASAGHPALLNAPAGAPAAKAEPARADHEAVKGGVAESVVRVDVSLLDGLIDLVGELVLARNQLVQVTGSKAGKGDPTSAAAQRVSLITSELQEQVLKTRMQQVNVVWGKLPRVVRDLALQCGKKVRVDMEGQDTELDKTIIEAIKDPLTHIVRNSVDHGIETAAERVAAGKNAEGRLLLRAFHEGGKVVIEIVDDGAGINPEKLKVKALQKGLITTAQAEAMTDHEAVNLIFLAGFSTAAAVTNVSGRGVGMDVVKTNIERINGSVDVQSRVGEGTTMTVRIPLTLAIVPALVVQSAGSRYAIPQPNLVELVRLKNDEQLERIEGAAFHRLRGRLLPVLDLAMLLKLRSHESTTARTLAVLQVDGGQFGLLVDRVNDAEEIVVKPLGTHVKNVEAFAGCTIMGDGTVALILDVVAVSKHAGLNSISGMSAAVQEVSSTIMTSLLLCVAGGTRVAVPLDEVARLEHLDAARVERSGAQEVVAYGSTLLPLVRLAHHVGQSLGDMDASRLKLVVTNERNGRSIGIVVDEIADAIEVPAGSISMQGATARFGVMGTAVIADQVTDVVDVNALTQLIEASYFTPAMLHS